MSALEGRSRPAWSRSLLTAVDSAFAVTGTGSPGWPDPNPAREPAEEAYSRVTDAARYSILGDRVRAWTEVLTGRGLARVSTCAVVPWLGRDRPTGLGLDTVRIEPVRPGGMILLLATTVIGEAPVGIDVGICGAEEQRSGERPVFLTPLPDCGCDACDSGSEDLLEELDSWVLTVLRGGVLHIQGRGGSVTRTIDGYLRSRTGDDSWLDPDLPCPAGAQRWVGQPWLADEREKSGT